MKVKEILVQAIKELGESEIGDAKIKARRILCNALNISKEKLFLCEEDVVSEELQRSFQKQIEKLKSGMPIQYILHRQEFMKLDFYIEEGVLIPQPDTEVLVEETIKIGKKERKIKILDLCTGTGCIGISLAYYLPKANVLLSDISDIAIKVAKENIKINQMQERVNLIQSNLFDKIEERNFDIIVSNPPYIRTEIIPTLDIEVQKEPMLALDGGKDGLSFYRNIIAEAWRYLKKEGYLLLEIGYDQKEQVENIVRNNAKYQLIETKKDFAGNDRVIIVKRR